MNQEQLVIGNGRDQLLRLLNNLFILQKKKKKKNRLDQYANVGSDRPTATQTPVSNHEMKNKLIKDDKLQDISIDRTTGDQLAMSFYLTRWNHVSIWQSARLGRLRVIVFKRHAQRYYTVAKSDVVIE